MSDESSEIIYLDYNATTPVAPEVVNTISETLASAWGNPSSAHKLGKHAKSVIAESRLRVAEMIGAKPEEIIFTSGGTEANNLAIYSVVHEAKLNLNVKSMGLPHVITTNVEHDSVIKLLENLRENGKIDLSIAEVDKENGRLTLETIFPLIKPQTCLISVMHANNESGVIMPLDEIATYLRKIGLKRKIKGFRRIFLHCDAAQTIGKIPVKVGELHVDYLTIVGHKFYGPRIGALYVKGLDNKTPITPIHPLMFGGGQENGYRSGTENTPMIAGLGVASMLVSANISTYMTNMLECRERFSKSLEEAKIGIQENFSTSPRLPNTVSLAVPPTLLASSVLEKCNGQVLASLGAACHSGTNLPSSILLASGLSTEMARRTIRFSMGRETSREEIDKAVCVILKACHELLASCDDS